MPLLARHFLIRDQPAVDDPRPVIQRRPRPWLIRLPGRRHRAAQRLPHRPSVYRMPIRKLMDRQAVPLVPPDCFE
jgi:hypothetical protein